MKNTSIALIKMNKDKKESETDKAVKEGPQADKLQSSMPQLKRLQLITAPSQDMSPRREPAYINRPLRV